MGIRAALLAALSIVTSPILAQVGSAPAGTLQTEVYPILWTYEACAVRHLRTLAATAPGSTFDQHEYSIRPACGAHAETARLRLLSLGYEPLTATAEINAYYRVLRPKLMAVFEWASVPRGEQVPVEPPTRVPEPRTQTPEPRDNELDALRADLLRELGQGHRECVKRAIAVVVPTSNEGAETLVAAVMALCMNYEQKRAKLLQGLFGIPPEQATRAVENVLEEEKRRILAEIILARALARQEALRPETNRDRTGSVLEKAFQ